MKFLAESMSEQATIGYMRHHTDIPAPQVYSYDASNNNDLGFEWMIMDHITGGPLSEQWREASWLKKEVVVREVISYLAQLFEKRFHRPGNLYTTNGLTRLPTCEIPETVLLGSDFTSADTTYCLSELVSVPFFIDQHLTATVPRGPFKSSRDWLAARIALHVHDIDHPLYPPESESGDEEPDGINSDEATKSGAHRLLALLPQFFPEEDEEEFVLHHHDLNSANILLDNSQDLTGIIDWECITTCPLWLAASIPKFLDSAERHHPPNPSEFPIREQDDGTMDRNEMYYERLEEYEKTRLRIFSME